MSDLHIASPGEKFIYWSARVLACAILVFWGYFIVAHFLGDAGVASRELNSKDYLGIASMVVSLAGLVFAFKWEKFGATLTLAAVAIGAIANWRILMSPIALIPAVAVIFLIHAYSWPNTSLRFTPK